LRSLVDAMSCRSNRRRRCVAGFCYTHNIRSTSLTHTAHLVLCRQTDQSFWRSSVKSAVKDRDPLNIWNWRKNCGSSAYIVETSPIKAKLANIMIQYYLVPNCLCTDSKHMTLNGFESPLWIKFCFRALKPDFEAWLVLYL